MDKVEKSEKLQRDVKSRSEAQRRKYKEQRLTQKRIDASLDRMTGSRSEPDHKLNPPFQRVEALLATVTKTSRENVALTDKMLADAKAFGRSSRMAMCFAMGLSVSVVGFSFMTYLDTRSMARRKRN